MVNLPEESRKERLAAGRGGLGAAGACPCQGNGVGPAGQRQKEVRRDGPWAGRGSPLPVSEMGCGVALS